MAALFRCWAPLCHRPILRVDGAWTHVTEQKHTPIPMNHTAGPREDRAPYQPKEYPMPGPAADLPAGSPLHLIRRLDELPEDLRAAVVAQKLPLEEAERLAQAQVDAVQAGIDRNVAEAEQRLTDDAAQMAATSKEPTEAEWYRERGLQMQQCPFCPEAFDFSGFTEPMAHGPRVVSFVPLNPVVDGHRLFVPLAHIAHAAIDPNITGDVFGAAAEYAARNAESYNLITSGGAPATQTVKHMHVHYVPRAPHDGLPLPWTSQQDAAKLISSPTYTDVEPPRVVVRDEG